MTDAIPALARRDRDDLDRGTDRRHRRERPRLDALEDRNGREDAHEAAHRNGCIEIRDRRLCDDVERPVLNRRECDAGLIGERRGL